MLYLVKREQPAYEPGCCTPVEGWQSTAGFYHIAESRSKFGPVDEPMAKYTANKLLNAQSRKIAQDLWIDRRLGGDRCGERSHIPLNLREQFTSSPTLLEDALRKAQEANAKRKK
jgi:hypothetical protein